MDRVHLYGYRQAQLLGLPNFCLVSGCYGLACLPSRPNMRRPATRRNRHNIKAYVQIRTIWMLCQINLRSVNNSLPLFCRYRLQRGGLCVPRLDLYKHQCFTPAGHYIDLAYRLPQIACQDTIAFQPQQKRAKRLSETASFLCSRLVGTRPRHRPCLLSAQAPGYRLPCVGGLSEQQSQQPYA